MNKNIKKHMSPMETKNVNDVIKYLSRDNYSTKKYWILVGDHITLTEQKSGEKPKQVININKKDFDRLIKWYIKKQQRS